jgi:hypothetical protein
MMHQEDMLMQKRKEQEGVLAFIKRVQAPKDLQHDIEQFYSSDNEKNQNRTDDLIDDMPYFIKVKMTPS